MKHLSQMAIYIISILTLASCATTHPGVIGQVIDSKLPLVISARTIENSSSKAFQLIEITLENSGDDWLKINNSKVLINNPEVSKLSVVLGDDLVAWADASKFEMQKDKHNKEILQAGLIGVGAATALTSKSGSDASVIGAALAVGTAGWAVTDTIVANYRNANGVQAIPKNHFYEPVAIPGKMFVRRWVLINKPSNVSLQKMAVSIEDVSQNKGIYEISF